MLQQLARWDARVSLALQARRNAPLNALCWLLSWSGAGGVWFSVGGGLYVLSRTGHDVMPEQLEFLSAMLGAFFVLVVGGVIKRVTKRKRPFMADIGVTAAVWAPGKARSFPSTHAATSVCLATALLFAGHPFAWPVAAWALGVTFSRVWLGVHFPTDVIGGAVLGVAFGFLPWGLVAQLGFA